LDLLQLRQGKVCNPDGGAHGKYGVQKKMAHMCN